MGLFLPPFGLTDANMDTGVTIVKKVTGVNMLATIGTLTTIYTIPTGKTGLFLRAMLIFTTVTGTFGTSTGGAWNVQDSTSGNVVGTATTALTTGQAVVGKGSEVAPATILQSMAAGSNVQHKMTSAVASSSFTTLTATVFLFVQLY